MKPSECKCKTPLCTASSASAKHHFAPIALNKCKCKCKLVDCTCTKSVQNASANPPYGGVTYFCTGWLVVASGKGATGCPPCTGTSEHLSHRAGREAA